MNEIVSMDAVSVFEDAGMVVESSRAIVPYAIFAQPKATEQWTELATKLPGLQDGDPVLIRPEPNLPIRLQPMRFTLLSCKQYWVQKDAAGNRLDISEENRSRVKGWSEEVQAACIIYLADGMAIPAACVFKTVKCPAVLSVKLQIDAASKPEWADISPAHKMAFGAFSKPFARVVGSVTTTKRVSASGFSYISAKSSVSPASPSEWKALKDLFSDGRQNELTQLAEHYRQRLAELNL